MKQRLSQKRLERRTKGYVETLKDKRIDSRAWKEPGSNKKK